MAGRGRLSKVAGIRAVVQVGSALKVSTEKMPDAQILMTIEVDDTRLAEARTKAVKKLSPKAKVPGFRPGKAPPHMVRQYFGEERILDEALDALVPVLYREAVEADESIEPIARPRLVVETTEPLVVKATIPVRPTIELGDYTLVRVKLEAVNVEEARVDETLLALRRRAATLEPTERGITWRDVVRIDVEGTVEVEGAAPTLVDPSGQTLVASRQRELMVNKQEAEIQLTEERDVLFPGFEEELLGKKKGDEFSFDLDVPSGINEEKYAGKECRFAVRVIEVKEEVLPELDEAFTKAVGEGFDSIDALRARIREDIEKGEQDRINNQYHDQILNELVDRAEIEFPPVMLDADIDRMLHDQFGHAQHEANFGQYLASLGKTQEQVREEFRPIAANRLRRSLVLSKVTEAEHVEVDDDEVSDEIEKLTSSAGPQGAQLRTMFDTEEGRATIRRNLLSRKTLDRLVEIATQDGGVAATAEQEHPATKSKKSPKKAESRAEDATVAAEQSE
jgi:trigger factor